MKHTLSVLVENRPGVLTHVSALISRRGYNIESIAASSTEVADLTRISIVVDVDAKEELEQICTQLEKLIRVVKVLDMTNVDSISREMALVKVKADDESRPGISHICDIFRGHILDVHPDTIIIEITGESKKIDAFCDLMEKYGIVEIIRTGEVCLGRSSTSAAQGIDLEQEGNR